MGAKALDLARRRLVPVVGASALVGFLLALAILSAPGWGGGGGGNGGAVDADAIAAAVEERVITRLSVGGAASSAAQAAVDPPAGAIAAANTEPAAGLVDPLAARHGQHSLCRPLDVNGVAKIRRELGRGLRVVDVAVGSLPRFRYAEVFDRTERSTKHSVKAEFFTRSRAERTVSRFAAFVLGEERPDGVFFDVGMNLGYYTQLAAAYGYSVHSFELQPLCMQYMTVSSAENGAAGRIYPHLGPVGNRQLTLRQRTSVCKSGTYDISKKEVRDGGRGFVSVSMTRLDDVVEKCGLQQVALMKLDVDGAEVDVLASFQKSLQAGVVKSMVFEIGNVDSGKIVGTSVKLAQEMFSMLFDSFRYVYLEAELAKWLETNACPTPMTGWQDMLKAGNIGLRQDPLPCDDGMDRTLFE